MTEAMGIGSGTVTISAEGITVLTVRVGLDSGTPVPNLYKFGGQARGNIIYCSFVDGRGFPPEVLAGRKIDPTGLGNSGYWLLVQRREEQTRRSYLIEKGSYTGYLEAARIYGKDCEERPAAP